MRRCVYVMCPLGTQEPEVIYEPAHDETNKMAYEDSDPPSLTSLRCALNGWLRTQPFFMRTANSDQAGRTSHFVGFVMRWLIYLPSQHST